jgi:hypothetical protein
MDSRDAAHVSLLAGHFFRRFLENDLVSPGGDGHENVAAVLAFLTLPHAGLESRVVLRDDAVCCGTNIVPASRGRCLIISAKGHPLAWCGWASVARPCCSRGVAAAVEPFEEPPHCIAIR